MTLPTKHLFVFVALSLAVMLPVTLWAHGTYGSVDKETGYVIFAAYDDGEPMSYTEVTLQMENDSIPYQTGRTDKYGCFMFLPKDPGAYLAMVRDEMGHGVTLRVETDPDDSAEGPIRTAPVLSKGPGLFVGLGFIFFLSGLGFWAKSRRHD